MEKCDVIQNKFILSAYLLGFTVLFTACSKDVDREFNLPSAANASQNNSQVSKAPTVTIDSTGLGSSPSISSAPRTVTLGGNDVVAYKAVAIAKTDCSTAIFDHAQESLINTPFTFNPVSDSANIVCAIGRNSDGDYQVIPTPSNILYLQYLDITVPSPNFTVTTANQAAFKVSGDCSRGGQNVIVKLAGFSQSLMCNSGVFSTTFNLTQVAPSALTVVATQIDIQGKNETASVSGAKLSQICNPFGGTGPLSSTNGLVGSVGYLPQPVPTTLSLSAFWNQDPITSLSDMLTPKYLVPAQIFSTQLNVPNQDYTRGFTPTGSSTPIMVPGSNQPLVEYFSINFRSQLSLASSKAGNYYLGVISDDGAVVRIKDSANGFRPLIKNDGDHWETFACPALGDVVKMDANTLLPIEVTYYQGPRWAIALQLIWKRIPDGTTPAVVDALCGSDNGFFDLSKSPSAPLPNWNTLTAANDGWEVIPQENFSLPPDVFNNCK